MLVGCNYGNRTVVENKEVKVSTGKDPHAAGYLSAEPKTSFQVTWEETTFRSLHPDICLL